MTAPIETHPHHNRLPETSHLSPDRIKTQPTTLVASPHSGTQPTLQNNPQHTTTDKPIRAYPYRLHYRHIAPTRPGPTHTHIDQPTRSASTLAYPSQKPTTRNLPFRVRSKHNRLYITNLNMSAHNRQTWSSPVVASQISPQPTTQSPSARSDSSPSRLHLPALHSSIHNPTTHAASSPANSQPTHRPGSAHLYSQPTIHNNPRRTLQ